ncbi:MAG: esterase family protein [Anaerolineae bacterium]|nr:esterase family protein [Anaerolineae bacterium]
MAQRKVLYSAVIILGGLLISACDQAAGNRHASPPYPAATDIEITPTISPTHDERSSNQALDGTAIISTPAPLACLSQSGEMVDDSIPTEFIPRPLEFRIYLPPCYHVETEKRYPVLYLIHGQNFDQDQWDRIGADDVVDELVAAGELAPFIIVMPRDRIWHEPPEDQFGESLITELIPWVDSNYRTLPERGFRAIGGLSRGAGWAVHLGLQHWELFGAIGAHSPGLFGVDTLAIPEWLEQIPPEAMPRIFIDVGRRDYQQIQQSAEWFGTLLDERDIPHEWYSFAGRHDELYWQTHVVQYIRFYAREW